MTLAFLIAGAVFCGVVLLLLREIRRSPGPMKWGKRPVWEKRLRIAFVLLLLTAVCVGIWSVFIEPNRLVIHAETIKIDAWPKELNGLNIAVISDIHAGGPFIDEKKLNDIVEKTNALHPDLIVLLGDYMSGNNWHSHRVEPEITAARLRKLRAPLGVFSVLGNHDWWYDGKKVRSGFEENGIRVLENEVVELNWRGKSFWLAGLADLWTRPQRVSETIAQTPPDSTVIAVTHNPDIFPNVPERVSLLLAGHTHGGQVNIPFIGTPIVPSNFGAKYTAGHVIENGHHLFVTTGIGISILPVRFRVPPEIVLLTLVS